MYKFLAFFALLIATIHAQHEHHGHATSYASFTSHVQPSKIVSSPHYVHPAPAVHVAPVAHVAPVHHSPYVYHSAPVVKHIISNHHSEPEHHEHHVDYYAAPKYEYKYGVEDHHTGDKKSQSEQRDGDHTTGEYSLLEPDGTVLTVKYSVVGKSGFNAQVLRSGHAAHPQLAHHHH